MKTEMKAAVYYGKNDVRVEEVPVPKIGGKEVLVKIDSCGICGTDLSKITRGHLEGKRILGHEMSGTIEEAGREVEEWRAGDKVAVYHHVPCLKCFHCAHENYSMCDLWKNTVTTAGFIPSGGGFAEYIKVPEVIAEKGITRIPSDTDFETATFLEPVNCGLKAVKRAQIKENDFVVVFGQGPAGILLTQLSSLHGAKVIAVDLIDYRLEKAVNVFGAVEGINAGKQDVAEEIKKITGGHGADTAITAVPNVKVIEQALGCVRKGGKFLMFAECDRDARITLDPNILYTAEIILLGSYSSSVKLQHEVEEIVFKKKIKLKEMVSHRFSLEEFPKALELALNPGRQEVLKIMIKPNI